MTSLRAARSITVGAAHVCGLLGGTATCVGNGMFGQLGQNGRTLVGGGFSDLAAGFRHTCGFTGGEVWCWGAMGPVFNLPVPTRMDFPPNIGNQITAIESCAGCSYVAAKTSSGDVYTWGAIDSAIMRPEAPRIQSQSGFSASGFGLLTFRQADQSITRVGLGGGPGPLPLPENGRTLITAVSVGTEPPVAPPPPDVPVASVAGLPPSFCVLDLNRRVFCGTGADWEEVWF